MSGAAKQTARLVRLTVPEHPRRLLNTLYNKSMRILLTLPEDAAYRRHTEKIIKERWDIVKENTDIATIEAKINDGQIGEIIIQAKYELSLLQNIQAWKPWEKLTQEAPPHQWTWPPHK